MPPAPTDRLNPTSPRPRTPPQSTRMPLAATARSARCARPGRRSCPSNSFDSPAPRVRCTGPIRGCAVASSEPSITPDILPQPTAWKRCATRRARRLACGEGSACSHPCSRGCALWRAPHPGRFRDRETLGRGIAVRAPADPAARLPCPNRRVRDGGGGPNAPEGHFRRRHCALRDHEGTDNIRVEMSKGRPSALGWPGRSRRYQSPARSESGRARRRVP